jgi:hypothetical protein
MTIDPEVRAWISVILGALIACGAALSDAFYFKAFGVNADLVIFMGGLAALGLHVTAVAATTTAISAAKTIKEDK